MSSAEKKEEGNEPVVTCSYCQCKPKVGQAHKFCGNCRSVAYCSVDHQKKHWRMHKPTCQFIKAGRTANVAEKGLRVVIIGGGSTGVCTAYYLSLLGIKPIIVERAHIACAASGYAGGFLAKNWCDNKKRMNLMRHSFALHQELQVTLNGKERYDFRDLDTIGLMMPEIGAKATKPVQSFHQTGHPWSQWITQDFYQANKMGDASTTCQVHPKKFVETMFTEAKARGTTLMKGIVKDVLLEEVKANGGANTHIVTGVLVDDKIVPCDMVLCAMGPWGSQARKWFPNRVVPEMYGQKCHSILYEPKNPKAISNTAVFVDFDGRQFEPKSNVHPTYEFYPRTHSKTSAEVYLHGMDEKWREPEEEDPLTIKPTPFAEERLMTVAKHVSGPLKRAKHLKTNACYMPVAIDGEPLIGPITGVTGAFYAGGTAEWGITLGPGTGKVMAELMTGLPLSFPIDEFTLERVGKDMNLAYRDKVQEQYRQMALQQQKRPSSEK